MRSHVTTSALLLTAAVACSGGESLPDGSLTPEVVLPGRATYTRDSAGIEIVDFPLPVKNLPVILSIDSVPLLDLGGQRQDPEHDLRPPGHNRYALQLSGPRYLVMNHNRIELFDSGYRHVVTMGAADTGRVRLEQLAGFCVTDADTVLALERNRVSVFSITGKFVRSSPFLAGVIEPSGCFSDGTLLLLSDRRQDSTAMALFAENASRIRRDGSLVRLLGAVQSGTSSPAIFMRTNNIVFRDLLVTGDGRKAEIRIWRISGRLRRVIRWDEPATLVTPDLLRAFVTNTVSADELEERLERTFTTVHPSVFPVYHQLRVDEVGRIWMLDYPEVLVEPRPPVMWTVFDSTGAPLGRVAQPHVAGAVDAPTIVWIGGDRVLLRWTDPDQHVHLTYHQLRHSQKSDG
jgi:hypothetical protein